MVKVWSAWFGFHSHGDTPIAGWFISGKSHLEMDDWGYPYFRKPPYQLYPTNMFIAYHQHILTICIQLYPFITF